MNNILVTGGAGYIGSITCRELVKAGFNPIILDTLEKGHKEMVEGLPLIIGSTLDTPLVTKILTEKNIKSVVHFAAYIEMGESMKDPEKYFNNNLVSSLSLFKAMVIAGADRLVFSSSAGVYGLPEKLPVKEDDQKNPNNPYGESKLMVERILSWYGKIYGMCSISLRYFNACGAAIDGSMGENHSPESHLIPNILTALKENREFTLLGDDYPTADGTCIRDYIHVLDLASAHALALQALEAGHKTDVYNIGTGKGYSCRQIIQTVEQVTGKQVKIKIGPRRPGDVPELSADTEKFRTELGWNTRFSDLETIIRTAWSWHNNR